MGERAGEPGPERVVDVPGLSDSRRWGYAHVVTAGDLIFVAGQAGHRLEAVRAAVAGAPRPRTLALEWLDPPFVGGHWVPEMIEIAGGTDAIGTAGAKSRTATWDELRAAAPEVVVAMPCGWDAERALAEALAYRGELDSLGADRVIAVDAAASFSRPGPRLVEGTELLAHLLHPDRVEAPPGVAFEPVPAAAPARG